MSTSPGSIVSEAISFLDLPAPTHHRALSDFMLRDDARTGEHRRSWSWGTLHVGNCVQLAGATLSIDQQGLACFKSVVYTNSTLSGDYWWSSFCIQDCDGMTLFTERFHRGPRMLDGNGSPPPRYHLEFEFEFPADVFVAAFRVLYGYAN